MADEIVTRVLTQNPIDGVDYEDGVKRFAGNGSIYLRILKSFVQNTPRILDTLTQVTPEGIADYSISVHGLKGSCYGISAFQLGDEAKALEFASKAEDWETVQRDNPTLIAHTETLIARLQALIDAVEAAKASEGNVRPQAAAPDKGVVSQLLEATLGFDAVGMQKALDELDRYQYPNARLVAELREDTTNFRYDRVQEKAIALLQ